MHTRVLLPRSPGQWVERGYRAVPPEAARAKLAITVPPREAPSGPAQAVFAKTVVEPQIQSQPCVVPVSGLGRVGILPLAGVTGMSSLSPLERPSPAPPSTPRAAGSLRVSPTSLRRGSRDSGSRGSLRRRLFSLSSPPLFFCAPCLEWL